jgi:AraC-like DNA-binding protein
MRRSLANDVAIFRQPTPQGVDALGTLAHQQVPSPEYNVVRLLSFVLYRDEAHSWSLCRLTDRIGIGSVILLPLHKRFEQSTGVAPHAWLRRRRIEQAKTLIRNGEHDVATVALIVGYANQSSFDAAFRRETGLTPTRWRRLT